VGWYNQKHRKAVNRIVNRHYQNCAAEGLLCAALLYLLEEFCCSVWMFPPTQTPEAMTRDVSLLAALCVLGAVLCGAVFWRVIRRTDNRKELLCSFAVSGVVSVVGHMALTLVLKLLLRVNLLPLREMENGDGVMVLVMSGLFTAVSLMVHLALLLVQGLRARWQKAA